jgi:glycerol-3-phosphate dehydrogenase (NAD(P)+)
MSRIAVIGDGAWGTALALSLARKGHTARIWGAFEENVVASNAAHENVGYLPGVKLPEQIDFTSDPAAAVADAEVLLLAMPSQYYAQVLAGFAGLPAADALVLSVTKGLDRDSHLRMSELAERELGMDAVAALSGPSFADEVAQGLPTAVVIACSDQQRAERLQEIFSSEVFRVYTSHDVIGTELGGALKNVIAIAAGVSDGIGFGDNSKAALITRGLAEIKRLGCALGARPETFMGLSGMGDLLMTCMGRLSRNRAVGERLGQGETIESILGGMKQVAEGVWNCANARAIAKTMGIDVPITEEVYSIVHAGKDPRDAVQSLLARDLKTEREG